MNRRGLLILSTIALAVGLPKALRAQDTAKNFSSEQLDQLLAPIALWPDALLAQVLMAATYPLEVVEAARWSQAHPTLKGDAAVAAVKDKSWDVSVKSLVAFPQVLATMNDKLEWTQKLGDAMIGQQKGVAEAIQRLRARAAAAGNLKTTPQQKVTTEPAPSGSGGANAIVIEPANPELIYVPYYNPAWAYGPWPWPAYPPFYYPPPPAYSYGTALMAGMMFGLGVAAGSAMFGGWHWGWAGGAWGASYTTVNINKATNISVNNFNASRYQNGQWQHDPAHRDGVPYRTQAERQQYGQSHPGTEQRQQFRGQLENRGSAATGPETRGGASPPRAQQQPEQRPQQRAENRGSEGRSSAFDGIDRGQEATRDYDRGFSSWGDRSFDRGAGSGGWGGGGWGRGGFGGRR